VYCVICCTIVNGLVWCRIQTVFAESEAAGTVCWVLWATGMASQTTRYVLYHCLHWQRRRSAANQQRWKSICSSHKCSTHLTTFIGTQRCHVLLAFYSHSHHTWICTRCLSIVKCNFFTSPLGGVQSIVMSMLVCLSYHLTWQETQLLLGMAYRTAPVVKLTRQ